jgi:hypothetical protein
MANKKDMPQCCRCFGKNWIDLGHIRTSPAGEKDIHMYQCGGAVAHADSDDIHQGCMRVIRATPEEMNAGGEI